MNYMNYALELAMQSRPNPNPRVGCIITKFGFIVGEGYHKCCGGDHAEIMALKSAGSRAINSTMYVTLEPCIHQGKTPPCVDTIISMGVKKVVIAMKDPNPLVSGKGIETLQKAGIEVEVGVLEKEAIQMNREWIRYITTGKPFVILKAAISLDGKIACSNGNSRWISCDESRQVVHKIRDNVDAVLVGIGTVLKDNPHLTMRIEDGKQHKNPKRIILDSELEVPIDANVLADDNVLVFTTTACNKKKKKLIEQKGIEVIVIGKKIKLTDVMQELGRREIMTVMIEGGSKIYTSAIEEGIVDRMMLFISPRIIGGKNSYLFIAGKGATSITETLKLKNVTVKRIGEDILLDGWV